MEVNAPVSNFRLPVFGESGYKEWELFGETGQRLDESLIAVEVMRLEIFSGDANVQLETVIHSPEATIDHAAQEAWGESFLSIEGQGFSVMGRDWHWFGKDNRIQVGDQARVVFAQELASILE